MDPISLDQTSVDTTPIDISAGVQTNPVSPDIAGGRAAKATYGLSDIMNADYDKMYQRIAAGQEQQLRKEAASAVDQHKALTLNKIIANIGDKQGPLLPQETEHIRKMVENWNPQDPNSVIEDAFSVNAVNKIYTVNSGLDTTENRPYSWLEDAMREMPRYVSDVVREGSTYGSKIEFARTLRENVQTDIDHQSYIGYAADQAKLLLQPYVEYKLRGNVPINTFGGLGTSLEEQGKTLLRLPPEQFKTKLTDIVNNLKKDNPSVAAQFLEGVIGESSSSIALNNLFTAIAIPDAFTVGGAAKNLARKAFLGAATRQAVKDTIRGLDNVAKQPIKTAVADAAGDLSEAAIQKEITNVSQGFKGTADPIKESLEALPDIMRDDVVKAASSPGRFGQEIVNRLRESYASLETNLFDTITRIAKVDRISPVLATEAGVRAIKEQIMDTYTGLKNSILNVSAVYKRELTNTYHADLTIGNPNGGYFLHKETAQAFADFAGIAIKSPDQLIEQQGLGWYIKVTKPVNETTHAVRDFLTATKQSQSPNSWLSAFAGWLRTPEETLAAEQLMNRKVATYAPSEMLKVAKDATKEIDALRPRWYSSKQRKQMWDDWERAVKYAQDARDPATGEKGYFFRTPGEIEQFYQQTFKRMPEMAEIEAYFAFKRWGEIDHVVRNLELYRYMSRVGAENHVIRAFDNNDLGHIVKSDTFQGRLLNKLPGGSDAIAIINNKIGAEEVYLTDKINSKRVAQLRKDVTEGRKVVVEFYDSDLKPLDNFGSLKGQHIRYAVVDAGKIETSELNLANLPYRGGGHFEYDYNHWIKQANIITDKIGSSIRNRYAGDTTLMGIDVRAMGNDVVNKLNNVRNLIRAKNIEGAKEASKSLPFEWNEINGWFKPSVHPVTKERIPARLDLNEPLHLVPRGRSVRDLDTGMEARYSQKKNNTFIDGTRSGSLARQYQIQYTSPRDAYDIFSLRNEGTARNPIYKREDAKLIDPIPAMNRAYSRIANSFFMDDYKISAIEHWLQEAKGHLDVKPSELEHSPFWYFNNLSDHMWKKIDPEIVSQLKTRHYQIKQFTGTASSTEALTNSLGQKLADSVYNKFGPEGIKLAGIKIDPQEVLSRLTDPVRFVRSLTFHAKLGLFAVPQFLVQSQTFVAIAGISGFSRAGPGAYATLLHQWSRINPTMIDALDRYASKLYIPGMSRWRPGEFKEAWTELRNTGFGNVAGEYALRDDLMSNKVIKNGADSFLDAGTFFFKEGEKNVRLGAWYTAYREFRDAHPTGAITSNDRRAILDRAALLNTNMDRSSNSILQHGALSIPTQFLTYQIRAAELFLGKRLTFTERARLFGTYAAVYGVPTATGLFGYPFGDNIRKSAIDNGYRVGEGYLNSLMEGIPAAMMQVATGNTYNIGERYGNQGFTSIRDAIQGDHTFLDIMGGAAMSTLSNTWTQSDGFRTMLMKYFRGEGWSMKTEDVVDIFKEISSVNQAWKTWAGINTGRWMNKKEQWASDVSPLNAIFQGVTGLQDQKISDARTMHLIQKDEKSLAEYSQQKFTEDFQRGLRIQNEDPKQSQAFYDRAFTWLRVGGFPEHKFAQAVAAAVKDNENLIAKANWSLATKDVPQAKTRGPLPYGVFTRENLPQQRYEQLGQDIRSKY